MKTTLKLSLLVLTCVAWNVAASDQATDAIIENAAAQAAQEAAKPAVENVTASVVEVTAEAVQKPAEVVIGRLASLRASASTLAQNACQRTVTFANKLYSKMPVRVQALAEKTYSVLSQHKKAVAITAGVAATLLVATIIYKKMQKQDKRAEC